ncbi:MAG: FG-GAP-like repeat-containing protein [Myxococcota bacterium]
MSDARFRGVLALALLSFGCGDDEAGAAAEEGTGDPTTTASTSTPTVDESSGDGDETVGEEPMGCGNGILEVGEECDDGNLVDGDGCESDCRPTLCGNGVLDPGEECDDGNLDGDDACTAVCTVLCTEGELLETDYNPQHLAVIDIDADGAPDVYVGHGDDGGRTLLLNDGSGNFTMDELEIGPHGQVISHDMDGDGTLDVVRSTHSVDVAVLSSPGDGTLPQLTLFQAPGAVTDLAAGDVDSDGFMDIVTVISPHGLRLFRGSDNGAFVDEPIFGDTNNPTLLLADLNADGADDLVVTRSYDGATDIYLGNAPMWFEPSLTLPEFSTIGTIAADVNDDGVLDLIGNLGWTSLLYVAFGVGDGTFETPTTYPNDGNAQTLTVFDPDGDGDLDIATSLWDGVRIALNDGTGHFPQTLRLHTDMPRRDVVAADFDGDGYDDLLLGGDGFNVRRITCSAD